MGSTYNSPAMSQHDSKEVKEERAYEKSRQFNNLSSQAYNFGLSHETWCTVEKSASAFHCRVKRKHFKQANKSTVFEKQKPDSSRMSGMYENSVGAHAEKRHFAKSSNVSQQQANR